MKWILVLLIAMLFAYCKDNDHVIYGQGDSLTVIDSTVVESRQKPELYP